MRIATEIYEVSLIVLIPLLRKTREITYNTKPAIQELNLVPIQESNNSTLEEWKITRRNKSSTDISSVT